MNYEALRAVHQSKCIELIEASTRSLLHLNFWDFYRVFLEYDQRMPQGDWPEAADQLKGELKEDVMKTISMYITVNLIICGCLQNNDWRALHCDNYESFLSKMQEAIKEVRDA